ncbi:SAM-dependent methyltransferase [Risungbinella massiliensis]|uniref:SAM-dependent methyltransferase n=1 Tax=Risungbinella massiliensis TaxID=1329796 RepID=UPI0005CC6334|nr:SAM-dependent methyltransferase [Risungbinella massiliensis]
MKIELESIGLIQNDRSIIEDDYWGSVVSTIILDPKIVFPESTLGLEEFSHLEVIYYMHLVSDEKIQNGARHPRNLTHLPKVGVFAQRVKSRPNKLGLSRCKLISVDGLQLQVQGLDALNGTPVVDIKPYFQEFSPREEVHQPAWAKEIMKDYFKGK